MDTAYNVAVPMKLDAFVLNPSVCNEENVRIAPITQPNYTFLRIDNFDLQNDTLNPVDVHAATPAKLNQRITKVLGSDRPADLRTNRIGVYLHWILPRLYRTGAASVPQSQPVNSSGQANAPVPTYPDTPNRWLVVRKLDPDAATTKPNTATRPKGSILPAVDAWVVESDCIRYIDDLGDLDLQTDVSPFISSTNSSTTDPEQLSIDEQAEVFIGNKLPAAGWTESNPPSVKLNLMNSSNQLFPDYQLHNSNVYSMIDTFPFYNESGDVLGTLTDAIADYYVLGWHAGSTNDDPFRPGNGATHQQILSSLPLTLRDLDNFSQWLQSSTSINTVCHGAMYGVEWHLDWTEPGNAPKNLPGNQFGSDLSEKMPVSVGTTTMDALLTYLDAHQDDEGEFEKDVRLLGTLLRAQDDSVNGRQAGADEVQNYNFARTPGGRHFSLPIDDSKPAQPPSTLDQLNLKLINQAQLLYDGASRMLQQKQWATFSLWWKFVTDIDNQKANSLPVYVQKAAALKSDRESLITVMYQQQQAIDDLQTKFTTLKQATLSEYNEQRDPTLFIGGLQSGWPTDFLDSLFIRLDPQIATYGKPDTGQFETFSLSCLPKSIQSTGLALVQEFLGSENSAESKVANLPKAQFATYEPLYHDQGPPGSNPPATNPWRDQWTSTQPWFPLFLEWEAEYHHVDYSQWVLDEKTAYQDSHKTLRYGLTDMVKYDALDTRTLAGRILMLPQPSFSLKGQLEQLFNSTPSTVLDSTGVSKDERAKLLDNVTNLPFASAPFDGFIDQLATMAQGSHLKPNVRVPGHDPVPLQDAWQTSQKVGLDRSQLLAMGAETELTPYATLVHLGNDRPGFKPATHGQFRITKLNVVDKFGQTACAVNPTPLVTGPPPFYPCISGYYEPQLLASGYPNTAIPQPLETVCDFMQISPAINQPARLNASFVLHDTQTPQPSAYWRPITGWENPIWGWVVVNYVDNGIQFFTQDGTFYTEVRIAAPNNPSHTSAGPTWLPFKPQSSSQTQLDNLILRLLDQDTGERYTKAFVQMINHAVPNSATAPSAYSQFVNAVIGKPLALANIGLSLEMACDAQTSQSTLTSQNNQYQPWVLLAKDVTQSNQQYTFPFKIGDHDRLHDGLIGYFEAVSDPSTRGPGKELDTSKFYTTYIDPDGNIVFPISNQNGSSYPTLPPFWHDPSVYKDGNGQSDGAQKYENAKNNELTKHVFGCVMDPFLPVNIYTSILPVAPISLPNWTWEAALKNMTAFFHFGPIMVTEDVPPYKPAVQPVSVPVAAETDASPTGVRLPTLKAADWNWLQPYYPNVQIGSTFVNLSVDQVDSRPRFEKGPYTAIEGYLQMSGSMLSNGGN